jgi:two-component system response regulator NreC
MPTTLLDMTSSPVHSILIVDNSRIFRQGLRYLLESRPDFEVVGDADDRAALTVAVDRVPTVILMSLSHLPGQDGVVILTQLRENYPDAQVIVLTASCDDQHLVYRAVQAGAVGHVSIDTGDLLEVEAAIRAVVKCEPYFSPAALSSLLDTIKAGNGPDQTASAAESVELSVREQRVLDLVASGFTNRQIALQLTITESTVRSHMHNILDKLKLTNRVQAAAFALQKRSTWKTGIIGSHSRTPERPNQLDRAISGLRVMAK